MTQQTSNQHQMFQQFMASFNAKLADLYDEGREQFNAQVGTKIDANAVYEDQHSWETAEAALHFHTVQGLSGKFFPQRESDKQYYEDPRCLMFIKAWISKRVHLSTTQRQQHLQAAKLLLHMADNDPDKLPLLIKRDIEQFMRKYEAGGGGSASGIDVKFAGKKGILAWMRAERLLYRPFDYKRVVVDKHKRAQLDTTSPEAAEKNERNRPPAGLDTALGEVLLKIQDGQNEPKPGYWRLRALMSSFMMGAGLRFGEAAALEEEPFAEIDHPDGRKALYLKVLSEKAGEPRLVPLTGGWGPLLKKHHTEVLELTADARRVARSIEDGSFFQYKLEELRQIANLDKITSDLTDFRDVCRVRRVTTKDFWKHRHLIRSDSTYFKYKEYVQAGLLPPQKGVSEEKLIAMEGTVTPGSPRFPWVPFENYEAWFKDDLRNMMSTHMKACVGEMELETPTLVRAGYELSLPLSKHLFITSVHMFHSNRKTRPERPRPMPSQAMLRFLRSSNSKSSPTLSVWEALNIRTAAGKIFELKDGKTTHVFRNWKDDARFRAGGNEVAIALLGGRKPENVRAYDTRTPIEVASQHRELYLQASAELIPDDVLGQKVKKLMEVGTSETAIQNLVEETLSVMHLTPWGGCSRELDREPCPKHYRCLRGFSEQEDNDDSCPNFHIDPNDTVARENIAQSLAVAKYQMASLERLLGEDVIAETLELLDLEWNPEQGHSLLQMQVRHQLQIIRGCEAALRTYENKAAGVHTNRHGTKLRQVASVDRNHAANLVDPNQMNPKA